MHNANGSMTFDLTPDPRVLIALTKTRMLPMDALCEIIDNAIDSFQHAKDQGIQIENPIVTVEIPSRKDVDNGDGRLRVADNGPGMTAENAQKAIRAGYSGNNSFDNLGLFGMGFNISTGKIGNRTVLATARKDESRYLSVAIDLREIMKNRTYEIPVSSGQKNSLDLYFQRESDSGTIIEVSQWWARGLDNHDFVGKLVSLGLPRIRRELGRRYATILSDKQRKIKIVVNGQACEAYRHCCWGADRYVERNGEKIYAVQKFEKKVGSVRKCAGCGAEMSSAMAACPACGGMEVREIDQMVKGWIGVQRFDDANKFGIDLIRNGRCIRPAEKAAFFEFRDDEGNEIKDYPIDGPYGRIIGEVHIDFVPVDFTKQDFQRSTVEWQKAMEFLRGKTSLQPRQVSEGLTNNSPVYKIFQGYRKVRQCGPKDLYMGYWDVTKNGPERISRDIEQEYLNRFLNREPGYEDDAEWFKLVEAAACPPEPKKSVCPKCGAQLLGDEEECLLCGEIIRGKSCVKCHGKIPISAELCPVCGAEQTGSIGPSPDPVVINSWDCFVCKTKNLPIDEKCKSCGFPKGTPDLLSRDFLLENSQKIDSLSVEKIKVDLPDGKMSLPIDVKVYYVNSAMKRYDGARTELPIIVYRDIEGVVIFINPSHGRFVGGELSIKQAISDEVAHYIFDSHVSYGSDRAFRLSSIAAEIMSKCWPDDYIISHKLVSGKIEDVVGEMQQRLADANAESDRYYEDLTDEHKKVMVSAMLKDGKKVEQLEKMEKNGSYLHYVPLDFIYRTFLESPNDFFEKKVFFRSVPSTQRNLLGEDVVKAFYKRDVNQLKANLEILASFAEMKDFGGADYAADALLLQQVDLSVRVISGMMKSNV